MMKLFVALTLGMAVAGTMASRVLAADESGAGAQRPDPIEIYLGRHAAAANGAEASVPFVGQTADGTPVVGHTAGPLPASPLSSDRLAAAAVAAGSASALAAAPEKQ